MTDLSTQKPPAQKTYWRSVEQLDSGLAALDIELSPEALAQLDRIFPGPGNQAPEAYAW